MLKPCNHQNKCKAPPKCRELSGAFVSDPDVTEVKEVQLQPASPTTPSTFPSCTVSQTSFQALKMHHNFLAEIVGSFCSALAVLHPHCSLSFRVLCAGVRSSRSHHLLTCKTSAETTKTYQPLFIQYKEHETCYYKVLKFFIYYL